MRSRRRDRDRSEAIRRRSSWRRTIPATAIDCAPMPAAEPKERTLDANGLRFRALEWEAGAHAATALLVHATSFCAEVWKPAWNAARAHGADGVRAVAIDQRG